MGGRIVPTLGFVALGLGLGMTLNAASQSANDHGGRVIEYQSGNPLVVSVKAWASSQRSGRDGNCSLYGDSPLDSRTSNPDGMFGLAIPNDNRTYTVTYCAAGYVPRDDRDIPNDANTPVAPMPATLWPVETTDDVAFENAVRRRLIQSLNEIAYLRRVNAEGFGRGAASLVEALGKDHPNGAKLLNDFANMAATWDE